MGKREISGVILLLIVCIHQVRTRAAETPPPASSDGDVKEELSTATLTDAIVLALLTARKDKGTQLEILFILILPSLVFALLFCDIPLRNRYPRFVEIVERLIVIFFVNGVMALSLPPKLLWVPALCFGLSLLTLIINLAP